MILQPHVASWLDKQAVDNNYSSLLWTRRDRSLNFISPVSRPVRKEHTAVSNMPVYQLLIFSLHPQAHAKTGMTKSPSLIRNPILI